MVWSASLRPAILALLAALLLAACAHPSQVSRRYDAPGTVRWYGYWTMGAGAAVTVASLPLLAAGDAAGRESVREAGRILPLAGAGIIAAGVALLVAGGLWQFLIRECLRDDDCVEEGYVCDLAGLSGAKPTRRCVPRAWRGGGG